VTALALAAGHGSGDWRDRALCRSRPDLSFFDHRQVSIRAAQAVCRACTVVAECAALADELGAVEGMWAGRWRGWVKKPKPPSPASADRPRFDHPPKQWPPPVLIWICCGQPECICE
jgi:hypothetical protein